MRELIYSYSLNLQRKIKEKKQWNSRWEKMSKATKENKLTIMIKRLLWEFNLYPVTVFLIAEKLPSLWIWNFQIFSLVLLTVLWKLSVIARVDYFVLQIFLEMGRKNILL